MYLPMFGALLTRKDERLGLEAPGAQEERPRAVDGDASFLVPIHMAAEGMTRPQALPTAGTPGHPHLIPAQPSWALLGALEPSWQEGGLHRSQVFRDSRGWRSCPSPTPFINIF